MRAKDVLQQLRDNNLSDNARQFLIDRLEAKPLVKNPKYGSMRCPNCDDVIPYISGNYCMQCGQRILTRETIVPMKKIKNKYRTLTDEVLKR